MAGARSIQADQARANTLCTRAESAAHKKLASYLCEWCECAFQRKDVPNTFPHDPSCPVCGKQLVEFELDNIAPEWNMDIAQDAEGNWVPKDNLEL